MSAVVTSQRHLLPADELSATFDFLSHKLTLRGKGVFAAPVVNGRFFRIPWTRLRGPGHLFALFGWTFIEGPGPVGVKFDFPFEITTNYPITIGPGGYVTIITLNHPRGIQIPVQYLGFKHAPGKDLKDTPPEAEPEAPVPTVENGNIKPLYTLEGEPFTISAPAMEGDPKSYTINADYNKEFLTLVDSRIDDGQIHWTFTAHKLGKTQVVVSQFGTAEPPRIGSWWVQTTYDVHVLLPLEIEGKDYK